MPVSADELLHDTTRRREILAEVDPYVPADAVWRHVGGYLGRSAVLQSGGVVLKCFFHAAESKWQRELRAYAFLAGSGLPVPRLVASGRLQGGVPWLLATAIPGTLAADVLPDLTDQARAAAFIEIGRLLARLHTLAVDERLTATPLAVARDAHLARLARIGDDGAQGAHVTHRRRTLELARSWAVDLLRACPDALACTHGDFSPRNLLFTRGAAGWTISGLIDFEHCEYADPAVDFARMLIATPRDSGDFNAFLAAYAAIAPLPSGERLQLQLAAIVLDAATWAERQNRAYYDALLDIVERISQDPDALLLPLSG